MVVAPYFDPGLYMTELDEVKNILYATEIHILKVHMTKQVITKSGLQCLEFCLHIYLSSFAIWIKSKTDSIRGLFIKTTK